MRIESDQIKTALALGVVVAVYALAFWLPRQREAAQLKADIAAQQRQHAANSQTAQDIARLRQAVSDLQRRAAASDASLPTTADPGALLRGVGARMADARLTDQEVQTETPVAGADYLLIPLSLRCRGSFGGVYDFLAGFESGDRLIRCTQLSISGTPTAPDEPLVVRLEVMTFAAVEGHAK
jgi:Tfp pilus assembly protein PilO